MAHARRRSQDAERHLVLGVETRGEQDLDIQGVLLPDPHEHALLSAEPRRRAKEALLQGGLPSARPDVPGEGLRQRVQQGSLVAAIL